MKHFSILVKSVLAAATLVLFLGCNNKTTEVAQPSEKSVPAGSIVFIQLDTLVNNYDFYKDLAAELQTKANAINEDISKKGRALERDGNDFATKVQKGLITRSQAETQNNQLQKRAEEFEQYREQKAMELQEENQVLVNKVMDAIKTYLKEYRTIKGYGLILTTSTTTITVIDGDESLDITNDVLKGLNEEYKKTLNK